MRRSSRRIRSSCRSSPKARALQPPRTRASHRPQRQLRARRRPARSTQQTTPRWERPGHTSRASLRLPRPLRATAARSHNPSCRQQRAIDGAEAEAVNQSDVDQANASSASAAITDILDLGPFVDGRSTTVASSGPARADNLSLVEQIVEQTQEILPEIPNRRAATAAVRTVEARGGRKRRVRHRRRSERGRDARRKRRRPSRLRRRLTATEGRDIRVYDQGSHSVELTFRVSYRQQADRWTEAARSRARATVLTRSGAATLRSRPERNGDLRFDARGLLATLRRVPRFRHGSTTVLIVTSPGIAAVLGASTTSEATGSDATEPREGRAAQRALPPTAKPPRTVTPRPVCGSELSGTGAGVSGGGATAALATRFLSTSPDDGEIQVSANLPGASRSRRHSARHTWVAPSSASTPPNLGMSAAAGDPARSPGTSNRRSLFC